MPADRSRPAFRAPDPLLSQRARRAATGVDEDCGKILRCSAGRASPGWAPPLPLLAFAYVVVRRWLNMTDMRIETSQLLRKQSRGEWQARQALDVSYRAWSEVSNLQIVSKLLSRDGFKIVY